MNEIQLLRERNDRLSANLSWLIAQIDQMHQILCPHEFGIWKRRTEQVVKVVNDLDKVFAGAASHNCHKGIDTDFFRFLRDILFLICSHRER